MSGDVDEERYHVVGARGAAGSLANCARKGRRDVRRNGSKRPFSLAPEAHPTLSRHSPFAASTERAAERTRQQLSTHTS